MKEYKIITVPLRYHSDNPQPDPPHTLRDTVRDFFVPSELSAEPFTEGRFLTEDAEILMQNMSREGWEVVSAVPHGSDPNDTLLFITFERPLKI